MVWHSMIDGLILDIIPLRIFSFELSSDEASLNYFTL